MNNDFKTIRTGIFQFLFGAVLSIIAFALYVISSYYPMGTESWLEVAQETLLFFSVFFFALAASRSPEYSGGLYLVAGFTAVCFIRELDAPLDILYHGCWKYFVLAYLVFLFQVVRKAGFRTVIPGLVHFIRSRSFMMMLPGVVIILAYSRLFGYKRLWQLYLPTYVDIGTVKTFCEESVELLGYAIIFGSSLIAAHERRFEERLSGGKDR